MRTTKKLSPSGCATWGISRAMGRTVFFGIDGLSHTMWRDLADSGVMPNSAQLIKESQLVPMRSSIPEYNGLLDGL
jgi:predicted AlkP superfamily phosphohydrolase/phosphomutase